MNTPLEKSFEAVVLSAYNWVQKNRQLAATAAGVLVAVSFIVYFSVSRHSMGVIRASEKFSSAQGMYSQGMTDRAKDLFGEVIAQYPSSAPATHARMLLAEIKLSEGDSGGAHLLSRAVYERGKPRTLRPFGLYLSVLALDEKGDSAAAIAEAEFFAGKYPDHFLTPRVYEKLGLIYEKSALVAKIAPDDARRIYERMAVLYPGSSWSARAAARISAMVPAAEKK